MKQAHAIFWPGLRQCEECMKESSLGRQVATRTPTSCLILSIYAQYLVLMCLTVCPHAVPISFPNATNHCCTQTRNKTNEISMSTSDACVIKASNEFFLIPYECVFSANDYATLLPVCMSDCLFEISLDNSDEPHKHHHHRYVLEHR